ncbi:MAG: hypothetical protein ACXW37_10510 [Nitrospira sp.]
MSARSHQPNNSRGDQKNHGRIRRSKIVRGASTPLIVVVFWVRDAGTTVAFVLRAIRTSMPESVEKEGVAGAIVVSMSLVT